MMPLEIQLSTLTLQLKPLSDEQMALKYGILSPVLDWEINELKKLAVAEQWVTLPSIQVMELILNLADEYVNQVDRLSFAKEYAASLYTVAVQLMEQRSPAATRHHVEVWQEQCRLKIQHLEAIAMSKELSRAIKDGFTQRGTIQEEAFTTAFATLEKALLYAQAHGQISNYLQTIPIKVLGQASHDLVPVIELDEQKIVKMDEYIAHLLMTKAAMNVMLDRMAEAIADFHLCLAYYEQRNIFEHKADVLDRLADAYAKVGHPKPALENYQASIKSFSQALEFVDILPDQEKCLEQKKLEDRAMFLERIADIWTKISQPKDAQLYYERCLLSYQLLRDEAGILRIKNKLNRLSQWSFDLPV